MNFRNPFGISNKLDHSSVSGIQKKINSIFDNFFTPQLTHTSASVLDSFPAVDVVENANAIIIKAELAQIDPKDVRITANRHLLKISGEKKITHHQKEDNYHIHELGYGSFSRTLELPFEIDDKLAKAEFKNGLLTINVGKPAGMVGAIKDIPVNINA